MYLAQLPGYSLDTSQKPLRKSAGERIKYGVLLGLAEGEYDLFITADKNIRYQQNLKNRRVAILVLSTNHWGTILANTDKISAAVQSILAADYVELLLS